MTDAIQASEALFVLAEGPVWDRERRRLVWVDILGQTVQVGRLESGRVVLETQHHFETSVGVAVVAVDGPLLVAEQRALTRVALDGTRTSTGPLSVVGSHDRFNDGVCDARGRFLVGTLSLTGSHHSQCLLQFGSEGTTVLDDDLGLSNGLAFSPDGATLYSIDSVPGTVWRRDYDQETGVAGPRSRLLDLSDWTPDGLAVDARGRLWIALWGSGEIRCFTPEGRLVTTVSVPAPHTSSLAFVGDRLDQLVITTARAELTPDQLEQYPLSGSLFLADPACSGVPPYAWSGELALLPS